MVQHCKCVGNSWHSVRSFFMALSQRDREEIEKLAGQIDWPLGSQGVASGEGDGDLFKYLDGEIEWNKLSPESKELWKRIQPQG